MRVTKRTKKALMQKTKDATKTITRNPKKTALVVGGAALVAGATIAAVRRMRKK